MSAKKYVPNRLRGVLGGDEPSPSGRVSSSSRGKGRKARPWRVDAASWKQQLQERKAVYDNFALQEKADEEKESSSSQITEKEEFESIPLNVLTSTTDGGGGRVDTMLTPRGGGQVEAVFTSSTKDDENMKGQDDDYSISTIDKSPTRRRSRSTSSSSPKKSPARSRARSSSSPKKSPTRSRSRSSSSSSKKKASPRRPSPLPRNRKTKRRGKRSPPRSSEITNDEELLSPRSANSSDSQEYFIDIAELTSSKSKDSTVAIIDGVAHDKEQRINPMTRARLLRHGSGDTAESIGFPGGEQGDSSSAYPVDKSSMMQAVENFIDPSRGNVKSNDEMIAPRSPIFAQRGAGAEIKIRESATRRGGRRRNRPPPDTATSTGGAVIDKTPSNESKNQNNVRDKVARGGDDEWSIRPVTSEEDQRWPVRPDGDTATVSSGDSDMISVDANYVKEDGRDSIMRKHRMASSLSPSNRKDKIIVRSSSERQLNQSEETLSATGTTPDPLQRARKTLLMSNFNRSVRSLDTSSHSRKDNDTVGDSSIESSYSTSIFVPLRSHRIASSNGGGKREIPLKVLDDHGVYVSEYNESGIFVPPNNDVGQSLTVTSKKERVQDMYNEHGAYVPRDKAASMLEDILGDDNVLEGNGLSNEEVVSTEIEKKVEKLQTITNIDSGDTADNEYAVHTRGENESENDAATAELGGISTSQEKLQSESTSPKSIDDDENLRQEGTSSAEHTPEDDTKEKIEHNDNGNEYGDFIVDEIDANRIRLVSDLTRYVSNIYTGNHVCVESIGTSEYSDPLDALRQKRAVVTKNTVNFYLKAQLNDAVSAMNTDHHHVIESPGKKISGKGKKWKERMAMKKLSKKNNAEKSKLPGTESSGDDTTMEEGSKAMRLEDNINTSDLTEKFSGETGGESFEELKETDNVGPSSAQDKAEIAVANQFLGETEETVFDAPNASPRSADDEHEESIITTTKEPKESGIAATDIGSAASDKMIELSGEVKRVDALTPDYTSYIAQEDGIQNAGDPQSLAEKPTIPSLNSASEKMVEVNFYNIDNGSNVVVSTDMLQEPNTTTTMLPESTLTTDISTPIPDIGVDAITFSTSEDGQENSTSLPISANDNNIIQGLPPNKGKKWKDRLKKKKNKKSEKNGAAVPDNLESGEGAFKSIEAVTADHTEETLLPSGSPDDITAGMNSKARPPFNRGISDLTAEEKQRGISPTNEAQTEISPKNVGKKSNKWKNRLAKMKGKTESPKPEQSYVQVDVKPESSTEHSERGQTLDDTEEADMNQIANIELPLVQPEATVPTNLQPLVTPKTPDNLPKTEMFTPTEASTRPNLSEKGISKIEAPSEKVKMPDPSIHKNLRQSFDVFDAFLQNGQTNQIDDESIYTEMTIGQETLLQSGLPVAQGSEEEEELSYMDFTYEESVQPSFVEQNAASKTASKDQKMMSPFMANLLSSRMFQDDGPSVPKMSLSPKEKQQDEKKSIIIDSPDEDMKKYPTITVGDAFDDEMTQITMGSLEDHEDGDEDEFFDAESKPFPRSPSSKSLGKKSKKSTNSRKSEGASSNSSPMPCSESSKQRIVEILRKEVWSRDSNVVTSAMEELNSEAKKGYDHRAHIVRCGGVMTIMRAMEMNSNSEAIQIASCSTLEKLSLEPQTQLTICEMEGISLIVRSMQVNVENVDLQEAACSALATICRHHEGDSSKDLMKDGEDAVPTVLSCMTRHQTSSFIQAKGFQAIANLCSGIHAEQRGEELSKAGGIMTLTMAIQTPWENKNDQQEAISNLSILLRGITELNQKSSSMPSRDAISKDVKLDGTGANRIESEASVRDEEGNGEALADNETVTSYMEEIPDMPMMSTTSIYGDEIPDLDQYPTMTSNPGWQNFGEDDLDAGRKMSDNPVSPVKTQQSGADGTERPGEEQCIIQ